MNWMLIKYMPEDGKYYETKIDDGRGERNHAKLKRIGNLFFLEDGTYVYYTPTHFLR